MNRRSGTSEKTATPKGLARRWEARGADATTRPGKTTRRTEAPGTIVGIPLGDGRHACARIVAVDPPPTNVGTVVVYRTEVTSGEPDAAPAPTSDFRVPPFLLLLSDMPPSWPVLAEAEGAYQPSPTEAAIRFGRGTPGLWRPIGPTQKELGGPVSPEEARALVSTAERRAAHREQQVREAVEANARWSVGDPDPDMVREVDAYLARRAAESDA